MEIFHFLSQEWLLNWPEMKFMLVAYGVGLAIEVLRPVEASQPSADVRFNFIHGLSFILLSSLALKLVSVVREPILEILGGPYITLQFPESIWGEVLYTFCFILIFDFLYYWFHRLQHKSTWLWAQHKLHHSDKSMNVTTSNRFHWLENSLWLFFIFIPMNAIFELTPGKLGLIWSIYMLWGYFIHLNFVLGFGRFTMVLTGPQYHRIHHSNLIQHQDKNFAASFPVYDRLFGSYYRPEDDEYPTTGLYRDEDMNHLLIAWFSPFKEWYQRLRSLGNSENR